MVAHGAAVPAAAERAALTCGPGFDGGASPQRRRAEQRPIASKPDRVVADFQQE